MSVYAAVILLSCLSFVTTAAGVLLAIRFRENKQAIPVGIGFYSARLSITHWLSLAAALGFDKSRDFLVAQAGARHFDRRF